MPSASEWLQLQEFITSLHKDSAGLANGEETLRRLEAGEFSDATPELRDLARDFLALRMRRQTLIAVISKMAEIQRLMRARAGSLSAEHRFSQINGLFDELTDDLLDVPEPHRKQLFGHLMPLRERLKLMERELG